jgi:hypothetical protein
VQRPCPNTINLHVDSIPQFPLHLPSGVYLALLSASSCTNVSSLNPLPSQPSHIEQPPWLRTGSRFHHGRQHLLSTTMRRNSRPRALDLKASCPLEGWGSIQMRSLQCQRPFHRSSLRL